MAVHYIYQIQNIIDKKIYVGAHSTKNINDDYMGSGTIIQAAIKKHGKNNFVKTILEYFDTSESMYTREAEIVNHDFVLREDTYNIALGGLGGWTKSNEIIAKKRLTDAEWTEQKRKNQSIGVKRAISEGRCRCTSREFNRQRTEKSLAPEAIAKRKLTYAKNKHQQKENHSQYGRIIVHKPGSKWIWINKDQIDQYIKLGYSRGKGGSPGAKLNGN